MGKQITDSENQAQKIMIKVSSQAASTINPSQPWNQTQECFAVVTFVIYLHQMLHNEVDVIGEFRGEMEEEALLRIPTVISAHLQQTYNSPKFSLPWVTKEPPSLGLFFFGLRLQIKAQDSVLLWQLLKSRGPRRVSLKILLFTLLQQMRFPQTLDFIPGPDAVLVWHGVAVFSFLPACRIILTIHWHFPNRIEGHMSCDTTYLPEFLIVHSIPEWPCVALHGMQCPPHWAVSIHHLNCCWSLSRVNDVCSAIPISPGQEFLPHQWEEEKAI